MKKAIAVIGLALIGLVFQVGNVWADANNANNADSLTITLTPNVDYGVDIDTTNVTLALGSLELYSTTYVAAPATMTILGTFNSQEVDVSTVITGGWSFDATPSTTTGTGGEQDALAMFMLFTSTATNTVPSGNAFGANIGAAGSKAFGDSGVSGSGISRAGNASGGSGTAGERFEGALAADDMDDLSPTANNAKNKRHIWFYLRLPSGTSTGNPQTITVTLTAVASS